MKEVGRIFGDSRECSRLQRDSKIDAADLSPISCECGCRDVRLPKGLVRRKLKRNANVACVGLGGMAGGAGVRHADTNKKARVVALCDVDAGILGG